MTTEVNQSSVARGEGTLVENFPNRKKIMAIVNQPPPRATYPPPRNKGLIRPYWGKPMVNEPLIRPYFWGVTLGGVWLTSHEKKVLKLLVTPPKTSSLPLKINGWKMKFPFWDDLWFQGLLLLVSGSVFILATQCPTVDGSEIVQLLGCVTHVNHVFLFKQFAISTWICSRWLEKIQQYSPKWWLHGDLPW